MRLISKQEGLYNKFKRQKYLLDKYPDKYKLSIHGGCAHVGPIRKGCGECLHTNIYCQYVEIGNWFNIDNFCNGNCPYCFIPISEKNIDNYKLEKSISNGIENFKNIKNTPLSIWDPMNVVLSAEERDKKYKYITYNITGSGAEPSLYMPLLEKVLKYYKEEFNPIVENVMEEAPTVKLYSNGSNLTKENIDKLVELDVTELRINPAAFNFSDDIFKKAEYACKVIPLVTFETAVYPPYEDKLMELPDIANQIGIGHISWCQLKVYDKNTFYKLYNSKNINKYNWYMATNDIAVIDDEWLTEKLIEKTIINNYNHSIIDCNAMVLLNQVEKRKNCNLSEEIYDDIDYKIEKRGNNYE